MLPPGLMGVTACLQRDQLLEGVCEVPLDPLMIGIISVPAVATMSAGHIMRDEVIGATYMDTVTTLVDQGLLPGA